MTRRVAVVGGGSSGLACIKCCLDEGLEPVCFESSDDIGGLWRFKTKVLQVKQRSDFSHSGQWDVETENKDGKKEKHIFDAVMICIGHHCQPNLPLHDFPGIDTFTGKYFHSREYKTPEEWRDKKVVVIGVGNSGGDIAVELSRVTKQLYLSTRRGAWVQNRVSDNGLPRDMLYNRVVIFLRKVLPFGLLCSMAEKRVNQRFNHSLYNLKPKHRLFSQHPTMNDDLPNRILSGTVQVKPNIRRFQGSSVEFEDGSVVEDVDLVVFATGYRFSFPFLASHVVSVSENKASLYKYVFPPELDRPSLAIIGLVQALGAIMPISEMQARWATRVFKGCIKLPSVAAMMKDIHYKQETMAKRYVASQRHTIQVDYISYMDEIAELVGVQPSISRLLLTDPRLGLNLLFGPCTPYQYRLRGPGKWAGARQAIFTQWERMAQPLQTRPCDEPKPKRSFKWPLILSAAAVGLAAYVQRNNLPAYLQDPTALLDKMKVYLPAQ